MSITILCYSQNENTYLSKPQFLSPQVAQIMRYDQMPVALNTGRLDLTIPVINFTDPDFDFPISISYNSGGYKPSEPEGIVGMNWTLNLGGVIHREVRGIPDELENTLEYIYPYIDVPYKGFLYVKNLNLSENFKNEVFNNPTEAIPSYKLDAYRSIQNRGIEPSSDVYTFNFCGYSGKFMIDFDGTPKVVSYSGKGKVKVDISGHNISSGASQVSIFKIITDNGYIYTFGGDFNAVEYTAISWNEFSAKAENPKYKTISAYHLTQIEAPNGRVLTIYYDQSVSSLFHQNPRSLLSSNSGIKGLSQNYLLCGQQIFHGSGVKDANEATAEKSYIRSYTLNKIALIEAIVTDNQRIVFKHSPRSQTMFSTDNRANCSEFGQICGTQIDAIIKYTNGKNSTPIETTSFSYSFSNRLFLSEIKNSISGSYKFTYNPCVSDSPFTKSIDHWNFWNGRNGRLIPIINGIPSSDRDPGTCCDVALLNKMQFPAGGSVGFEYEPHILGGNTPELGGGARVRYIYYYDSNNLDPVITKYYTYVKKGTNSSSGSLSKRKPIYTILCPENDDMIGNSFGFNLANNDSYHIQYSEVNEYNNLRNVGNNTMGAHVTTIFSGINDYYSTADVSKIIEPESFVFNNVKHLSLTDWFAKLRPQYYSHERGKVLTKYYYSDENKLVKSEHYEYERSANEQFHYVIDVNTPRTESWVHNNVGTILPWAKYTQISKVYLYPYNLVKKEVHYYWNESDNLDEFESYNYEPDGYYVKYIMNVKSDDVKQTAFTYAYESENENDFWMRNYNILSPVIERKISYNKNKIITIKNNYSQLDKDVSNNPYRIPTRNIVLSSVELAYGKSPFEKRGENLEFDIYGNILYQVEDESKHTVYLWSYVGKYPIAKIENATYKQVKMNLTNMDFDSISMMDDPKDIMNEINALRNKLPNTHITTYTYKPLVGLLTATDPAGITTYYDYDNFGRLKETYIMENNTKKVIQQYAYHYQNQ
jgi:YD repeat-containing protein